jgi:hypothetical protein
MAAVGTSASMLVAFQEFFDLFVDDRPECAAGPWSKAVFLLVFLIVHSLEICISFVENAVYWAFSGLALSI